MQDPNIAHSESLHWRFTPRHKEAPFAGASIPRSAEVVQSSEPVGSQNSNYYATSFPPELYERLRIFVQAKGWNTLLDGVTFQSGERIVDVGFGDGGNTHQLASDLRAHGINCVVFGVEKASEMVQRAQESYPRSENPNLFFFEGMAEDAGGVIRNHLNREGHVLLDAPITRVISNYSLHWVRDPANPARFLHKQMFCSLNPLQPIGGEQRHFCAHEDAFKELFKSGYDVIKEDPQWHEYFQVQKGDYAENNEWRHPPLVSKQGIEEALSSAGYTGTATLHIDEREFPSVDLLKAWVKTMIRPFMNRIPEEKKQEFVDVWIERYLKDTLQRDEGSVKLWDRNLLVVATKVAACEMGS